MNKVNLPTNAIIAVTLNCNSKCVMCDIWKNRIKNELKPKEYLNLPPGLKDINITGGEPLLRKDLPEIIESIKVKSPKAKLILNTNGYLPKIIQKKIPQILQIDPNFVVRVSIDGWKQTHDNIRRIPNGFNKILKSIKILKRSEVKDLGISFTIIEQNYKDLEKIHQFSIDQNIELSLTIATDSSTYFGKEKKKLRPNNIKLKKCISKVVSKRLKSTNLKEWFRGWFEFELINYILSCKRPLECDAGKRFFYLDSVGNIYTCNIKNWLLGNIRNSSFNKIWNSQKALSLHLKTKNCQDCWMICNAKTQIKSNIISVSSQVIKHKFRTIL